MQRDNVPGCSRAISQLIRATSRTDTDAKLQKDYGDVGFFFFPPER